MAGNGSADEVRALTPNDINRMINPQFKHALSTIVTAGRGENPTNAVLLEEIRKMRKEVAEIRGLRQEVESLSTRLDDAYTTIHHQQLFLEYLDGKERRRNVVITGVSENADELGGTDEEKVKAVLETARYPDPFNTTEWTIRRLGQEREGKKRPIHIEVNNQQQRDGIVNVAKNLKQAGRMMEKVYIRKDTHPAVRKENTRIRKREKEEKEKPANIVTTIEYDWRRRVLLRDGVVIDRFMPQFF